jgi:hypothetical protein
LDVTAPRSASPRGCGSAPGVIPHQEVAGFYVFVEALAVFVGELGQTFGVEIVFEIG